MESAATSCPRAGTVVCGHRTNADDGMECRHAPNVSSSRTNGVEEQSPATVPKDGETQAVLFERSLLSASKSILTHAVDDKIEGLSEAERGFSALKGLNEGEMNEFSRKDASVKDALPIIATSAKKADAGVLLLLVGISGSGKSTFCSKLMANAAQPWTRICQDILAKGKRGTKIECLKHAERALAQILSVVIDRCNNDKVQRLEFLRLAASFDIEAHGVVLDLPASVCIDRGSKRKDHEGGLNSGNAGSIINRFRSTRQLPSLSEGFSRIAFCRTDTGVENALQQYRELIPSKHLESGVFGAVLRKNENALQLVFGKGSNQTRLGDQPHGDKRIESNDRQVEKATKGPQQAQLVGREDTQQMQETGSPYSLRRAGLRRLHGRPWFA